VKLPHKKRLTNNEVMLFLMREVIALEFTSSDVLLEVANSKAKTKERDKTYKNSTNNNSKHSTSVREHSTNCSSC